jgi:hypothetical protein
LSSNYKCVAYAFVIRDVGPSCGSNENQFLISKRLLDDHAPAAPAELVARARHDILVVGNVPVVNCETLTVCSTVNGAAKLLELSLWIV